MANENYSESIYALPEDPERRKALIAQAEQAHYVNEMRKKYPQLAQQTNQSNEGPQ
jgi:hypothetical protein